MSTEPTNIPAVTQVVEEPTTTTELTTTEPTTTEEPKVEEPKVEETATPAPTASKSSPTKRLSLFLGKAKNYVDKVVEKKPTSPTKAPTAEPEATTTEEPTATVEEAAAPTTTEEVEKPKQEKRKSFLGIFRSKSPVQKEVEKTEDTETPAEDTSAGAIIEEEITEPTTEAPKEEVHHKDNVIGTIKKGPLSKLFKKKEAEHPKEVTATTPPAEETAEPVIETTEPTTTEEPATTTEEKRPGSPLGRRFNQIIRGLTIKKKTQPTEEKKNEETSAVSDEPQNTSTETTEEPKTTAEHVVTPTVQATA